MALSEQALTTVERMQRVDGFARIDPSLLEDLIEEASAEFVGYCGRTFHYQADLVERVKGFGTSHLFVSNATPIESITSIAFGLGATTTTVDTTSYSVEDAKLGIIRSNGGSWAWTAASSQDITGDPIAGTELRGYAVTYTGGYITPQQELDSVGARTLPRDIERAVIELTKTLYYGQSRDMSIGARSTPRGSQSMAFNTLIGGAPGLPLGFTRVADRYKVVEV